MSRTQTPSQYDRMVRRRAAERLRKEIDGATTAPDVDPRHAASVARDAELEDREAERVRALGQIPPVLISPHPGTRPRRFRVVRETPRVVERREVEIVDGVASEATYVTAARVELILRSRASTLHQHWSCACARCLDNPGREIWYHDGTRTFHARRADGTFEQIP